MNVCSYDRLRFSRDRLVDPPPHRSVAVLVVSEHDIVRSGFRLVLSQVPWIRRCLGARTLEEAMVLSMRYEPNVVLVELSVGAVAGIEICRRLLDARPQTSVLLMSLTERMAPAAVAAVGACGFVSTGAPAEEITDAIRTAGLGQMLAPAPKMSFGALSERQRAVLTLIAAGATNRQIADALCLSPHTVKGHTTNLYRRLRARNRAEAVHLAQRSGLLV